MRIMTIFSMIFRGQVRIKRITMNIYVEPTGLNVSVTCCLIKWKLMKWGFMVLFAFTVSPVLIKYHL